MSAMKSVYSRVKDGLARTRSAVFGGVRSMLIGRRLDESLLKELERSLIRADVGVGTTRRLIEGLREDFDAGRLTTGDEALEHLKRELKGLWGDEQRRIRLSEVEGVPTVIVVAGVNGAGKTTSVAKLASSLQADGKQVLLGACDTFRAGAVRQLEIWSERLGMQIVKGQEGGDPAAVAFDACEAALARGANVLIIDTAGRLHTQDPLMRQLQKIRDVVAKRIEGAPHEVLLVLDATSGQNAVRQAEQFTSAIDVSGLFLAKLDGTAKGGVVIAVHEATGLPVKFVGVGETLDAVEPFDPETFVEALLAGEDERE